jgi:hypothetical protein
MGLIYRWMVGESGVCDVVVGQATNNGKKNLLLLLHSYVHLRQDISMGLIYRWMVGEWGVCDVVVGQATNNGKNQV